MLFRRRCRHPPASNGKMFFSALVSICRAVGAPIAGRRRPAPNALAADSVPVEVAWSVWTSLPVRTRPAPIAMVFVGPVLMRRVRPVGASASVRIRSAMSASGFHHSLLSLLFRGRTPCPRRPSLQYSRLSRQSFTSRGKMSPLRPVPPFGVYMVWNGKGWLSRFSVPFPSHPAMAKGRQHTGT